MITRARAYELRRLIERASISLEDSEALEGVELFPAWKPGVPYSIDTRIRYDGVLYKCVQSHTSQGDWTPDVTPALWMVVSIDEFPAWRQPTGAQDAYNTGDKVSHNNKHWISTIDANVWEPSVYGWDEI